MQTALCNLHNAVCIISKIISILAAGNYRIKDYGRRDFCRMTMSLRKLGGTVSTTGSSGCGYGGCWLNSCTEKNKNCAFKCAVFCIFCAVECAI